MIDAEKFFDAIKARVQMASEVESLEHRLKKVEYLMMGL